MTNLTVPSLLLDIQDTTQLFSGALVLEMVEGVSFSGDGAIELSFRGQPRLKWRSYLDWSSEAFKCRFRPGSIARLAFLAGETRDVSVSGFQHDGMDDHIAILVTGECYGLFVGQEQAEQVVDSVLFSMPNLGIALRYQDVTFNDDIYEITLQRVSDYDSRIEKLRSEGGYSVTVIGRLRKLDSTDLTRQEAQKVLGELGWFLSFANGGHTFPLQLVGHSQAVAVWHEFNPVRTTAWEDRRPTWCSDTWPEQFEEYCNSFGSFRQLVNSSLWNDSITEIIDWYISSLPALVQQAMISIQAALELFAWNVLVNDRSICSKTKYKTFNFKEVLRGLFMLMSVDCAPSLFRTADATEIEDFVDYRNSIIHPERNAVIPNDDTTKVYIAEAGFRFIEMCVLSLLGYQGTYVDRRQRKRDKKRVPWA